MSGEKFSPARTLTADILAMYAGGDGHQAIATALGISPRIARVILIEEGVWRPNPKHNGRANKGTGEYSPGVIRRRAVAREAIKRATHCLSKRAPKAVSKWRGMSNAQVFASKYKEDIEFRVVHCLRKRLHKVAKRGRGYSGNNLAWLGCAPVDLLAHIESLWLPGMTWANYGVHGWHIDHIKPCAAFDMMTQEGRDACFHWSNLQPLWSGDNLSKGSQWQGARHGKNRFFPTKK